MLSFRPASISDLTQRVHVVTDPGNPVRSIFVNDRPTAFFAKMAPRGGVISMIFLDPDLVAGGDISIRAVGDDMDVSAPLPIEPAAMAAAAAMSSARKNKADWLRTNVRCPECMGRMNGATCENGHHFEQPFHCMNLLSREISEAAKLAGGEFVSRHALHPHARAIIEYAKAQGGMALDFGAGLKFVSDYSEHSINLEIEAYPTTDIVAAGQRLPFPDNTFEGVFSLSVLEHVSDPFKCASEMARVLKPGGKLLIGAPFLFQEHGYPEHYYNMTRRGVANLFEGHLEITGQWYGRTAIPSLLKQYHASLPKDAAQEFENTTIGDIIRASPDEALRLAHMNVMSHEARWRFAHGSYLTATKR